MATRRKYKPKGYFRGGAVPVVDDMLIPGDEPSAEPHRAGIEDDRAEPGSPLQQAIDAQARAEELQRQPLPLDQHLDSLPISDHKKAFLRAYPELLVDEFRSEVMALHYRAALAEGIEDDTHEMDNRILQGVQSEVTHQHQLAMDNIRRRVQPAPAAEPEPAPIAAPPAPARTAAAPPARKVSFEAPRSVLQSPPVSRDSPMPSGGRPSQVTLTPEERAIARRSFTAPDMTDAQKELLYAQNKRKLAEMRARGEYPQPERN